MSSKYKEYKDLNFARIADEVLEFWRREQIFEKSVTNREGAETFTFYEGPPSANGTPGIHHVMARTVKDIFCRFKTLQGFQVKRKGGWDTHGFDDTRMYKIVDKYHLPVTEQTLPTLLDEHSDLFTPEFGRTHLDGMIARSARSSLALRPFQPPPPSS